MNPVDDNTSQQANLPAPNPVDTPHGVSNGVEESLANMQPVINNDLIQPSPHSNSAAPLSPHSPSVADDVDLIEKEWVLKAKAIVSQTKDDPSQQSKDMNKFKADYLKTRYSKDIKVSEA
mgnify:CR=1 FL=1